MSCTAARKVIQFPVPRQPGEEAAGVGINVEADAEFVLFREQVDRNAEIDHGVPNRTRRRPVVNVDAADGPMDAKRDRGVGVILALLVDSRTNGFNG